MHLAAGRHTQQRGIHRCRFAGGDLVGFDYDAVRLAFGHMDLLLEELSHSFLEKSRLFCLRTGFVLFNLLCAKRYMAVRRPLQHGVRRPRALVLPQTAFHSCKADVLQAQTVTEHPAPHEKKGVVVMPII